MDWEWWRSAAAIWGAGLSTLLALTRMLPTIPKSYFEPSQYGRDTVSLVIRNAGDDPLQISSIKVLRIKGDDVEFEALPEDRENNKTKICRASKGYFSIFIPKEAGVKFEIFKLKENSHHLFVFMWHRHSILPSLPHFRMVRGSRLNQMNGGGLSN